MSTQFHQTENINWHYHNSDKSSTDKDKMSPSTFSLSLFAPFLRRSKKYKKLETDEPEKKKQEEAIDELTRINFKIVSTIYLVCTGAVKYPWKYIFVNQWKLKISLIFQITDCVACSLVSQTISSFYFPRFTLSYLSNLTFVFYYFYLFSVSFQNIRLFKLRDRQDIMLMLFLSRTNF